MTLGVSAWIIWRQRKRVRIHGALILFGCQLVLNGVWSYLFFGLEAPGLALADILMLWAVIVGTLISFWRLNGVAGVLLVPYLLWVSFAVYLNVEIWRLNAGS